MYVCVSQCVSDLIGGLWYRSSVLICHVSAFNVRQAVALSTLAFRGKKQHPQLAGVQHHTHTQTSTHGRTQHTNTHTHKHSHVSEGGSQ